MCFLKLKAGEKAIEMDPPPYFFAGVAGFNGKTKTSASLGDGNILRGLGGSGRAPRFQLLFRSEVTCFNGVLLWLRTRTTRPAWQCRINFGSRLVSDRRERDHKEGTGVSEAAIAIS